MEEQCAAQFLFINASDEVQKIVIRYYENAFFKKESNESFYASGIFYSYYLLGIQFYPDLLLLNLTQLRHFNVQLYMMWHYEVI